MQARSSGVLTITGRAFAVALRHLDVLVPLALLVAVPATALTEGATSLFMQFGRSWLPAHGIIPDPQTGPILAMALAEVVVLPWLCAAGALVAAATIGTFMLHQQGRPCSLGDALSYGFAHWRRLIGPYTAAALIIWVGSIVIVPGVLYTLLYAFVAPVAVLDSGVRDVLRRSTKLTRGRRGRIFRTYMLFVPWWGWYATVGALLLEGQHWAIRYLCAVGDELVGFAIGFALLQLYLERMEQLAEALASKGSEPSGGLKAAAVETILV